MIVHAYGGLCNRLRVILSYRAVHGEIGVVWLADEEIAGARFLDVFEPIAGVQWMADNCRADVRTLGAHRGAPLGSEVAYRELRMLAPAELPAKPYAAIHVRRTDHVHLATTAGTFTDDLAFMEWIRRTTYGRVYIATDNRDTQEKMATACVAHGKRPLSRDAIPVSECQRQTTLEHSAFDLFACAHADAFMGSGESSFSATIETLRSIGGWWT